MVPEDKLYKAEDGSALRFYWDTDKNNFLSEKLGKPTFDNVLYLEIISPGSRESTPVYEVIRKYPEESEVRETKNVSIFERYSRQIEAYLNDDVSDRDITGTALTAAPFLDKATIASLYAGGVHTVEGLGALSDEKLRIVGMGGRTLRDQARAFVEAAKGGEGAAKLAQEIADLKDRLLQVEARAVAAEGALAAKGSTDKPPPPIVPPPVTEPPIVPPIVPPTEPKVEEPKPEDTKPPVDELI